MQETKAHEYARDSKLKELQDHLSKNPTDVNAIDTVSKYHYYIIIIIIHQQL
jgi:hypothetical protein